MQDIILALVQPLAEWTVRPVWRQLSYVFHYKSNIEHLNEQVLLLCDKREGVNLDVTNARQALKEISPGVNRWLDDADKIIVEEETSFSKETVAAKAACYNGWLPNLKCRHYFGRKAKKMTDKVDKLLATAPTTIAHPASHLEVEFQPTEDSTQLRTNLHEGASSSSGTSRHENPHALLNFDSRRSTVRKVMEALRRDQINPIIICGMGGIGKTTLMGQVIEKAKQEGLFDEYTKATFKESLKESLNKDADLCVIQDELARYLGLPLEEKETDARANKLRQRLSQGSKKILVLLDNVWTTTPDFLWEIGVPSSCKLLVTSRQQDLFKNMDTRKNFPIDGLSDGDAWSLFKRTAGSCIESDPELHVVAKKVLKECAGLPIAISTVGTALKGESIAIWKNAAKELERANPENVPGVIEHVYGKIMLSYECLPNEQAKSCMLLCCLFEESSDIPIEDLVRYGLGLGLFKGVDSMVEGRNRVETLVQTLKSRFLLLESDEEPRLVRMHDVVRDVALYIASEEFVEKKNDGFEKRIVVRDKTATMKMMDLAESESSAYFSSLGISGLCQLLLIRRMPLYRHLTSKPPPTILNRVEDLKILAILGWDRFDRIQLPVLVPSLAVLRKLETLRLEWSNFNSNVSVIGDLRTLRILSLRGSVIKQLPETFKNLSDLRLLDLTDCEELTVISPGVISSLTRLEELYMQNSFRDWAVEKLASTETINWISQLEERAAAQTLTVDTWKELHKLAVEQPAKVGEMFRSKVLSSRGEKMDECTRFTAISPGVISSLTRLEELYMQNSFRDWAVEKLASTETINWISQLEERAAAQTLTVDTWKGLHKLADEQPAKVGEMFRSKVLSSRGEKMDEYTRWGNFMDWKTGILAELLSLTRLTTLQVDLPPVDILLTTKLFNNLERFQIFIGWDDWYPQSTSVCYHDVNFLKLHDLDASATVGSGITLLLKKTNFLRLCDMGMKNWAETQPLFNTKVHFPVLKELETWFMDLKDMWNNDLLSAESFRELKSLNVRGCPKLLHLVPTHMQNRLQKLESIEACSCPSLEEIFEFRRSVVDDERNVTSITVSKSGNQGTKINKMMSINLSRQAFQNLTCMSIEHCGSLRTVMYLSIAIGLVKLQTLKIGDCGKIEEIVAAPAEGEETEDDNMFPQLDTLVLKNLPKLVSFSKGKYNFKWSVVKKIQISRCRNMKKFCSGSLSTPKEVEIDVWGAGKSLLQDLIKQ